MKLKQYHLIGLVKNKPGADPGGAAADDERRASVAGFRRFNLPAGFEHDGGPSSAGVSAALGQSQRGRA